MHVIKDVVYAASHRPLHWDIYRPEALAADAPVVLLVHGGGFRTGDRSDMADACMAYVRRGFVAIACEYRYLTEAKWPAPVEDVKLALRTISDQSVALGVSSKRVFLMGFSAGGQMCLIAANELRGAVAGIACAYGPTRLGEPHGEFMGIDNKPALLAASPIEFAAQIPPTILFYGAQDPATPDVMGVDLYMAIKKAGGVADLRLYAHMIHGFARMPGMTEEIVDQAVRFFGRAAIDKADFDAAVAEHHQWWEQATSLLRQRMR
jgi:acetyl esterase/lipase